jgi:nicotinamide mononucleotide transporter
LISRLTKDAWILAALTLVATAVSLWLHWLGRATWLEVFSFVSGALCVWLTVKENVWNFPISLANVVAFAFVFFEARLFADAGLQVVYFILTAIGWYMWLFGGEGHTELRISRVGPREAAIVAVLTVVVTVGLTIYLRRVGDAAPFFDALTTAISLAAQWLLNRKQLENWWCWILVDVIYIPLYAWKGLYLTSILYAVFLCMATMGLLEWQRRHRAQRDVTVRDLEMVTA